MATLSDTTPVHTERVRKSIQAKDIPDDEFIAAVAAVSVETAKRWGHKDAWANRFDVAEKLGFPEKVVLAKARAVIKKGRMEGCTCGCRGDFDLRGYPDDPFKEA